MITTNTADVALKSYYLDVLRNQLNTNTNPFYNNKIVTTSKNIIGHKVVRLAPYALNGGFGFSSDSGNLPQAGSNKYTHFETTTKDMYGVIEISDKAMKASRLNTNSFVDLLTQEMKGILEATKFNYSRALFTDGTGVIATVVEADANQVQVDSVKYLIEGMIIDIVGTSSTEKGKRILAINRAEKIIVLDGNVTAAAGDKITVQNSYGKEITGLGAIFNSDTTQPLYGVNRSENYWMVPYISENTGAISDLKIQTAIDYLEETAGSKVDYISCSYDVRRNYLSYLELTRRNIDPIVLEGGFQAISFSGIPLVADRHCPDGTMDLLNSKSFQMHTLSDWDWLDDDGKILKQIAGKPAWTAVLAKYGELMCDHPGGQARLSGITA